LRPVRCILSFHNTKLVKAFTEDGDELFGRPSLYVSLRISQCRRCGWYQFVYGKIINKALFTGSYWQPDLSSADKEMMIT